jgi:uncharacterized DUF497 family protein
MEFQWDPNKAAGNLRKHGVSLEEAATAFGDPLSAIVSDPDHSTQKDRYLMIARSAQLRLLIVSFVERGDRIRIISARRLTRSERKAYEEETSE